MSNETDPGFDSAQDADDAARAAASSPTREDSVDNVGDPDADGGFQERADKTEEA